MMVLRHLRSIQSWSFSLGESVGGLIASSIGSGRSLSNISSKLSASVGAAAAAALVGCLLFKRSKRLAIAVILFLE
jgi:hypothetical protein